MIKVSEEIGNIVHYLCRRFVELERSYNGVVERRRGGVNEQKKREKVKFVRAKNNFI